METLEMTNTQKSFTQIDELNFSKLKLKLMNKEEGESWTFEECDNAEWKYKMFLKLVLLYPKEKIVPDKEVDTFWHYHILDTKDYIKVTNKIFGYYVHHNPYFGLNGNSHQLSISFKKTLELYKKHFGVVFVPASMSSCTDGDDSGDSSTCSSRCSN